MKKNLFSCLRNKNKFLAEFWHTGKKKKKSFIISYFSIGNLKFWINTTVRIIFTDKILKFRRALSKLFSIDSNLEGVGKIYFKMSSHLTSH